MADWCVYLLLCGDGSLYCGVSNRPAVRFAAHCAGRGARYTRLKGAREMRLAVCCLTRAEALRAEHGLKRLPRAAKLELWRNAAVLAVQSDNNQWEQCDG